jgi:hypothetical protein
MSDQWPIISRYSWQQAVEDGDLVELFENRWPQLSNGKPILATSHIYDEISLAGLREIWNEYVVWMNTVMPTLREEDRMFSTTMNSKKVWVIDDGTVFTLLYPEDY